MPSLPDMLTVEEAARILRVGRTKAYAMANEWRATGGRTGLPVIDLGHVLRVPRHALETLVGGQLLAEVAAESSTSVVVAKKKSTRRAQSDAARVQLDLFGESASA